MLCIIIAMHYDCMYMLEPQQMCFMLHETHNDIIIHTLKLYRVYVVMGDVGMLI